MFRTLLLLLLVMNALTSKSVTAKLYISNQTTSDSYYVNQMLTISCHDTDIPAAGGYNLGIGYTNNRGIVCIREGGLWIGLSTLNGRQKQVTDEQCDLLHNGQTITLRLTISLLDYNISCQRGANGEGSAVFLPIDKIKVPPDDIILTIEPRQIAENDTVTVKCSSSSAKSVYRYEAHLLNGSIMVIPGGVYSTSPADRDGFILICKDTEHSDWINSEDITAKIAVHPTYIAVDHRGTVRTMELNTRKAYTLTCNIRGNPRPVYQWMSTLTDLSNIHNQILLLQNNTHKNGISEGIECFGLRTEFEEEALTITWQIQWKHQQDGKNIGLLFVGFGLCLGIGITTICALMVWKRNTVAVAMFIRRPAVGPTTSKVKTRKRRPRPSPKPGNRTQASRRKGRK